jgi:alkane 1-monooxygenase
MPALYAITFYLLYAGISPMYLVTFIFFCLPICDEYFEFDMRNPTKEEEKKLQNDIRFKFPLYISVFLDWFLTIFGIKLLLTRDYNLFNQAVILFGLGVFSGSNINVAHELSHKTHNMLDYMIGWLTMAKCLYMHWVSEHLYGHHKWVATPNDPATSKKNQNLYAFYI